MQSTGPSQAARAPSITRWSSRAAGELLAAQDSTSSGGKSVAGLHSGIALAPALMRRPSLLCNPGPRNMASLASNEAQGQLPGRDARRPTQQAPGQQGGAERSHTAARVCPEALRWLRQTTCGAEAGMPLDEATRCIKAHRIVVDPAIGSMCQLLNQQTDRQQGGHLCCKCLLRRYSERGGRPMAAWLLEHRLPLHMPRHCEQASTAGQEDLCDGQEAYDFEHMLQVWTICSSDTARPCVVMAATPGWILSNRCVRRCWPWPLATQKSLIPSRHNAPRAESPNPSPSLLGRGISRDHYEAATAAVRCIACYTVFNYITMLPWALHLPALPLRPCLIGNTAVLQHQQLLDPQVRVWLIG
ncbi:hypothetical protein WJX73_009359 [Symbiochloris irregularis]|uniref:Uncharacterized protein n=1 Tax=Symbiochloris irregularis TaxID=706552 RepID=A0AAW1NSM2_9CHLO